MSGSPEPSPTYPDPLEGPGSDSHSTKSNHVDNSTPPETSTHIDTWVPGDLEAPTEGRSGRPREPKGDDVLFGKYRVIKELGSGGLGRVYLVRHLRLDTDRALKTILPRIAENPKWR